MHTAVGRYKGYVHVAFFPLSIDMISNASVHRSLNNADDIDLALYSKRELLGSPAVLAGVHEVNRAPRAAHRNTGPVCRAGLWVNHHLAVLMMLGR